MRTRESKVSQASSVLLSLFSRCFCLFLSVVILYSHMLLNLCCFLLFISSGASTGNVGAQLVGLLTAMQLEQKEMKEEQKEMKEKSVSFMQTALFDMKDLKQQTKIAYKSFTPSAACKSENNAEFTVLFESLKLAYGPRLSELVRHYEGPELVRYAERKFNFKWGAKADVQNTSKPDDIAVDEEQDVELVVDKDDKILEKTSYMPLMQYLKSLNLHSADVSEGVRCQNKNLFNSDVFTLRKGTAFSSATLRVAAQAPVFIQNIHGRTDIIILRNGFVDAPVYHKAQVRVAVEIKTIKGLRQADGALREAAIQLVGLNTQNCEVTPVVLLTNFAHKHYVLYLTMGSDPEHNLKFDLHIVQFVTFESALEFAEDQSVCEPISVHFGRKPTPPASVASDEDDN